MSDFFHGERVKLTSEVVFIDEFTYNNKRMCRVAYEDRPWSFIVDRKDISKKSVCENAPFAKCNNAEGCDTCEHKGE